MSPLKYILAYILIFVNVDLAGQVLKNNHFNKRDSTQLFNTYYPKLQYEYGGFHNVSFGIGFVRTDVDMVIWTTRGPFIDLGLTFSNGKTMMSNKIGFEYYYLFLATRGNLVNTTDFKHNQVCFRPEIGLTLFTKLTIMYGYNLNLSKQDNFGIRGSVLSINVGVQ